jgi:hypothetical protein
MAEGSHEKLFKITLHGVDRLICVHIGFSSREREAESQNPKVPGRIRQDYLTGS